MSKQFLEATLKESADDMFTFVGSDETLDRVGEVIPIDSWNLKNYKKNPILLVNHDYKVENIVGKAKNTRVEDGKLLFDAVFHDITPLARDVKEMVKQGILSTVSVGFMRKGPKKDGDMEMNELFEISFVPVPANPSASRLKALMDAGIEVQQKDAVTEWVDADLLDDTHAKEVVKKLEKDLADAEKEEIEEKEGRVLSDKNRSLIQDASQIMKQAASALDELLNATEPRGARDSEPKSREPKEERAQTQSVVVRALQTIAKASNEALAANKLTK